MIFSEGTAADREVLRESEYQSAVDLSVSRHDTIGDQFFLVQSVEMTSVLDECVDLDKAVLIEQNVQTFSRSQLTLRMLCFNSLLSAAELIFFLSFAEILKLVHV